MTRWLQAARQASASATKPTKPTEPAPGVSDSSAGTTLGGVLSASSVLSQAQSPDSERSIEAPCKEALLCVVSPETGVDESDLSFDAFEERAAIRHFDGGQPLDEAERAALVEPPDLEAFLDQQTLQHPAARERELHVQLVDPVHQLQIGVRHWARLEIDAAPADPQHEDLAADAQLRGGIDYLLALGNRPAFPSAPDKKSF